MWVTQMYTLLDLHNCFCYVDGNFFSTVHALIGYFEVTWHLTMKLFPAKISEQATMQNPWRQRATVQCYLWMLTIWEIYFHTFVLKEGFFFFMGYITNHLKTGPSGFKQLSLFPSHLNVSLSSTSGNKINAFPRNQSLNVYYMFLGNCPHTLP